MKPRGRYLKGVLQCAVAVAGLAALHAHPHSTQFAYIGPGAGFAFLGSFLTLVAGFLLSVLSLLLWPFRMAGALVAAQQGFRKARVRKIIFLGLDGLDPRPDRALHGGRQAAQPGAPGGARAASSGCAPRFRRCRRWPGPPSPPASARRKHNMFDFLNRSLKTYMPRTFVGARGPARARAAPGPVPHPALAAGGRDAPQEPALLEDSRQTRHRLHHPARPHHVSAGEVRRQAALGHVHARPAGHPRQLLAVHHARGTGDLRERQPLPAAARRRMASRAKSKGRKTPLCEGAPMLRIPFRVVRRGRRVRDARPGAALPAASPANTPPGSACLPHRLGAKVNGIARFLLTETEPEFSAVHVADPDRPGASRAAHQPSAVLCRLSGETAGPFATVGMAEDTWALNEGVIDEDAFLEQAWHLCGARGDVPATRWRTRAAAWWRAFSTPATACSTCSIATSAARTGTPRCHRGDVPAHGRAGRQDPGLRRYGTALFVLSDHGFCAFRRGVNINSWLRDNGYLHLRTADRESGSFFDRRGLEPHARLRTGPGRPLPEHQRPRGARRGRQRPEAEALKHEIIGKLAALRDEDGATPIRAVYATAALYRGPYLEAAPDLIVGYNEGYRCSWEGAVGKVEAQVLEDNPKAWSGDHCVDPVLVPGRAVLESRRSTRRIRASKISRPPR